MNLSIFLSLIVTISVASITVMSSFSLTSLFIILGYPHFILSEHSHLRKINYNSITISYHFGILLLLVSLYFLPLNSNYFAAAAAQLFVFHVFLDETKTLNSKNSLLFNLGLFTILLYLTVSLYVKVFGLFSNLIGPFLLPMHIRTEFALLILYHYFRWYIHAYTKSSDKGLVNSYFKNLILVNGIILSLHLLSLFSQNSILQNFFSLRFFWLITIFHILTSSYDHFKFSMFSLATKLK